MRNAILFSTACLLIAISTATADDKKDEGWVSLFDGKTLTGWKANERPDNWTVKDGAIVGNGERSHLYYMKEQLKDFELKADVMINEGGN